MTRRQLLEALNKLDPATLDQPALFCTAKANVREIKGVRLLTDEDTTWIEEGASEGSTVLFTYEVE